MSHPISMRAMRVHSPGKHLELEDVPIRHLHEHELLLKVTACGVCRTDLHLMQGELPNARYPITPGHEIVGRVVAVGAAVAKREPGDRVGVPWLGASCGECADCERGLENLCEYAQFTGCTIDGGYEEVELRPAVETFALEQATEALDAWRTGACAGQPY